MYTGRETDPKELCPPLGIELGSPESHTDTLPSSIPTFAVALNIAKAFDRIWHKALLSKLPSYSFYPAICSFLSRFLSGHSIAVVVDSHCSTKMINSGVPQGSVLSPSLFLLFINDLLSLTNCPIYSYSDDTTLHYSTSFDRQPNLQELQVSRKDATECLTSDLSITLCSHIARLYGRYITVHAVKLFSLIEPIQRI